MTAPRDGPLDRQTWYLLVVIVVCMAALIVAGALYTRFETDRLGRKFCELVVASDEAYKQPPPPGIPITATRVKLADANHRLRESLDCDDR